PAPGAGGKRRARRGDGRVHVGAGTRGRLCDHLAGGRVLARDRGPGPTRLESAGDQHAEAPAVEDRPRLVAEQGPVVIRLDSLEGPLYRHSLGPPVPLDSSVGISTEEGT